MARIRTLAGGIAAWIAVSTSAAAAPLSWFDSQATLTAWYATQLNSGGNIYAPPSSANAVTNLTSNWYARSVPAPVAAPVARTTSTYATVVPAATSNVSVLPAPVAAAAPTVTAASITPTSSSTTPAALSYTPQATFGSSTGKADAFINLGGQPYAEASSLTVGDAKPWYQSPAAASAFGGTPTADQQAGFTQDVLNKVEKTFQLSGLNVNLTADPNVPASHTMSVVSGASYGPNANAIGITDVGNNGFTFIDKLNYATNEDQLSWAVAHNVSHELMHAFGIGQHPDQTGDFIDAATANWNLLTDPNTTFSPSAVALLKSQSASGVDAGSIGAEVMKSGLLAAQEDAFNVDGDQVLAAPVPEPATLAVWVVAGLGGGLVLRRRNARQAA
ncbi:PEP-CTERM sorting domain-containing protein [Paludisphaera mucosa]|uniref:PEP-CTERM sorting domain-containing protein n=1 Tax=Paludisphaera mucosa TaxID=3030827 RepID=A0ABT6F5T0_9BACT|nr:PEP-CTERM sorting domain-containing protein [Paludisphaera mucosa]MDG3002788.1 PEP-CTERM sorting domain-containing protein [Paludisphaera mucosa]